MAGCSDPVSPGLIEEAPALAPQETLDAAKRGQAAGQQEVATVVDIALAVNAKTGEFSSLIAALSRVGLVSALQADGQFTVFAPTDAAFAALLAEKGYGSLDAIDDATLTAVLLYHVAPGRDFSRSVLRKKRIKTLQGGFLSVKRGDATLIDAQGREANILVAGGLFDIPARNGVVHVIDRVVLP